MMNGTNITCHAINETAMRCHIPANTGVDLGGEFIAIMIFLVLIFLSIG